MARRPTGRDMALAALRGGVSGAAASWVMERAQERIAGLGSAGAKARERRAQGDLPPATHRAAQAAARTVGRSLDERQERVAAEVVHYLTGAGWGAVFGLVCPRVRAPAVLVGMAFGTAVWLLGDELLTPALGFSRPTTRYPPSTHAKALASHLVYGGATGSTFALLGAVLR